ncbi:hypothetical protein HID58_017490 [Brassica napus]|uniref:Uncharacterized protein n=1 Tax=Brassica napus TaxID=3708 RepID=A0ABQ8D789_BRANA|nr:hypothetical protein HID58_017490 [Brassica napus]
MSNIVLTEQHLEDTNVSWIASLPREVRQLALFKINCLTGPLLEPHLWSLIDFGSSWTIPLELIGPNAFKIGSITFKQLGFVRTHLKELTPAGQLCIESIDQLGLYVSKQGIYWSDCLILLFQRIVKCIYISTSQKGKDTYSTIQGLDSVLNLLSRVVSDKSKTLGPTTVPVPQQPFLAPQTNSLEPCHRPPTRDYQRKHGVLSHHHHRCHLQSCFLVLWRRSLPSLVVEDPPIELLSSCLNFRHRRHSHEPKTSASSCHLVIDYLTKTKELISTQLNSTTTKTLSFCLLSESLQSIKDSSFVPQPSQRSLSSRTAERAEHCRPEKDCSCGGGGATSSAKLPSSSSTEKSSVTATLRRKREAGEVHLAEEEEEKTELSLKETEGGKREEGLETEKGRELGLKVERAREEAEAAMVNERRRDKRKRLG